MSLDDYFEPDHISAFKREKKRHLTKREQILQLLMDGKWHSNAELSKITPRYGARLKELRDEGWIIEKEYVGEGLWLYRLVPRKEVWIWPSSSLRNRKSSFLEKIWLR